MLPRTQKTAGDEDCVEAEIVSGPGAGRGAGRTGDRADGAGNGTGTPDPAGAFYALFRRVRAMFVGLGLLAGFGLIFLGFILTSTVLGAVIGVPLLILGVICLWLIFKLLSLGAGKGSVVFRRF
ncbi:MAG TPA: hypothetical protein PL037_05660 [Elusimicrobiales bacterium]|nr:hypothetical protein [Elusimicrobiales bacterium]